ncbi:MAG: acyl-CoA thioesterase [Bacteroidia bacterium]
MEINVGTYKVRWADVDANGHLRHSAYADFCAHARVEILENLGLGVNIMRKLAIGPILFREELIYKREIHLSEEIKIETFLSGGKNDGSRWAITHLMYRNNNELACTVNVEGAWMDLRKRKLGKLPEEYSNKLNKMPKTKNFSWQH